MGKATVTGSRPAGKIDAYMHRTIGPAAHEVAHRRIVSWSAVNFRPENTLHDVEFKLFVGNWTCRLTAPPA